MFEILAKIRWKRRSVCRPDIFVNHRIETEKRVTRKKGVTVSGAQRFKILPTSINLLSKRLVCYLLWKCVFIKYRKASQVVDVFSKLFDENGV